MTRLKNPLIAVLLALSAAGCSAGPRDLVAGEDACRYCRMTIDDVRFGGMVITSTGRMETFDAVECLASFVAALPADAPPRGVYVADFNTPSRWVAVRDAQFLYRSRLHSPMGRTLAAFEPSASVTALREQYGGDVIAWSDVLSLLARERFAPSGAGIADTGSHQHGAISAHNH